MAPWPAPWTRRSDAADADLARLPEAGVDMDDVARVLEDEGVASFAKSYDELLQSLHDKASALQDRLSAGPMSAYPCPANPWPRGSRPPGGPHRACWSSSGRPGT